MKGYQRRKQPGDPEWGVSGNARQSRAAIRKWRAKGYRVVRCGSAGQVVLIAKDAP